MIARLRVLVVDDEPMARAGLADLIRSDDELLLVGECGNGRDALRAIERLDPDLVLLDVQMPVMDGFAMLRELEPDERPMIVFVTAYDAYAVEAFEQNAVDYILKPFADPRARAAIDRAKRAFQQQDLADLSNRLATLIGPAQPPAVTQEFLSRISSR